MPSGWAVSHMSNAHEDHYAQQPSLSSAGSSELREDGYEEDPMIPENIQQDGHAHGGVDQYGSDHEDSVPRHMDTAGEGHPGDPRQPKGEHLGPEDMDQDGNEHVGQDVSSHLYYTQAAPAQMGRPSGLPRQALHARTSTSGRLICPRLSSERAWCMPCTHQSLCCSPIALSSVPCPAASACHLETGAREKRTAVWVSRTWADQPVSRTMSCLSTGAVQLGAEGCIWHETHT